MSERENAYTPEEPQQPIEETGVNAVPKNELPKQEYDFLPTINWYKKDFEEAIGNLHSITENIHETKLDAKDGGNEEKNIIFLDKSARPFSAAFQEFWSKMYPEDSVPNISYLNIGKELLTFDDWDPNKKGKLQWSPEIDREVERIQKKFHYLRDAQPKSRVYIIDELEATGATRQAALSIMRSAFPNLTFSFRPLLTGDRTYLFESSQKSAIGVTENEDTPLTSQSYSKENYPVETEEVMKFEAILNKTKQQIEKILNAFLVWETKMEALDYQKAIDSGIELLTNKNDKEGLAKKLTILNDCSHSIKKL